MIIGILLDHEGEKHELWLDSVDGNSSGGTIKRPF